MISQAQVKIELGITSTTYDSAITAKIPQAEAKYREVAGNDFNWMFYATYTNTESVFKAGGLDYAVKFGDAFLNSQPTADSPLWQIKYGDLIEGTGVPAGTYVTAIDKIENEITVSNAFTADGDRLRLTTNISYYPTISQIIWFMIAQQTTTAASAKEYVSRSVGPLSWTLDPSAINKRYGIPEKLVQAIPRYVGVY